MKGDFTRTTFDPQRHFSSVRMQQGRVQLDADWNEQLDITAHRVETEAVDLIGRCGAPLHDAGLQIAATAADLPPRQQTAAGALTFRPGDLYVSAGRFYVDGILCENEQPVLATGQPDLPADAEIVLVGKNWVKLVPPPQAGLYLVYVDVWQRHLTAIEAPHVLETALGGPDTCTRTKTVWQVKLCEGSVCPDDAFLTERAAWLHVTEKPTGKLSARAEPGAVSSDPCIVAPGAGYRRLENQLYRVEVHKSGNLGNATFKWSRDNGSILTTWESKAGNDLTVGSIGRDKPLGFAAGQWVELTDDDRDQLGQSGTLVQLTKAEGKVLTINPATATGPVDLASFKTNPKIRRWDSAGPVGIEVPGGNQGFIPLEGGVEVKFSDGTYRAGDYWLIPARTTTGDVEWPKDPSNNNAPIPQPPDGIEHHYCSLAVAEFNAGQWTIKSDCRKLFPPVTELTNLFYIGGDGQEMAPDPAGTQWLCGPLQVRVLNGGTPVEGAQVRFQILEPHPAGTAKLETLDSAQNGEHVTVITDALGLAACRWRLDASTTNVCQKVSATLFNRAGLPTLHQQVIFTGRLEIATLGEPNLTRIVATSWRHGVHEADLYPISELVGGQDKLVGVGFVIAFSDRVTVPRAVSDHVLEVLIPVPRTTATPAGGSGGGMPFTLLELTPQSIYQCWCPLLTGHDPQGRPLGRIVPVTCALEGPVIAKARISPEPLANGIAFLLESNSLTHALVNQLAVFDQFWVRLRCDFVLDEQQRAVDGEYLRAHLPSGDRPASSELGIQGGLFESWFNFRGNFRGGHIVPVIDDGQLRADVVTFWRKTKATTPVLFASVNGGPPQFMASALLEQDDVTNPNFDVRVSRHTLNLTPGGPQMIDIRWEGASRVSHVPNVNLGGFNLHSRIRWSGQAGVAFPITLNLRTVNRNVIRGQDYRASLGASSPHEQRLTYDQALSENITAQPPGLVIDPQTGLMTINGDQTPKYKDNPRSPGADFAFSGTVHAQDGSFVKFEGLFDGVNNT